MVTLANVKFQNKDHVSVAACRVDCLCHSGTQVTPIAKIATDEYHFVPPRGFTADRDFNSAYETRANGRKRNRFSKAVMITLTKSRSLGVGTVNGQGRRQQAPAIGHSPHHTPELTPHDTLSSVMASR
jgi:hypothetical protein